MKPDMKTRPKTADDWLMLEFEISSLFDGAPIDEEELFGGFDGLGNLHCAIGRPPFAEKQLPFVGV